MNDENGPELTSVFQNFFMLAKKERYRKEFKLSKTEFVGYISKYANKLLKNNYVQKENKLKEIHKSELAIQIDKTKQMIKNYLIIKKIIIKDQ